MFYLNYFIWLILYALILIFFNFKKVIFKILKYPFYPETFKFDDLSFFWKYLLIYFYSNKNFLSKLPLEFSDIENILLYRKYINFPFRKFMYFNQIKITKIIFFKNNFNSYKNKYKLFLLFSKKSFFLNLFFYENDFFLKFISLNKIIFNKRYLFFFYDCFFSKFQNFKNKNKIDYFTFIYAALLKNKNKFIFIKTYQNLTKLVFYKILYGLKKPKKIKKNFFFEKSSKFFEDLLKKKKIVFKELTEGYSKLWILYIIKFPNGNNLSVLFFTFFFENFFIIVEKQFIKFFKICWPIRFQNNGFTKFLDKNNSYNLLLFLRKNKIFNKGRYSRNRQIYRTGVYMCLYINIIFVYFYIFLFYRFTFNFGFLWIGIGLFIISMVLGRASKYRLYNFKNFILEFNFFFKWVGVFFKTFLNVFKVIFKNYFKKII